MFRTHTLQMADTYSQTFLPLFPLIFSPSSILFSVPQSLSFLPSLYSLFPHPFLLFPPLAFPDKYLGILFYLLKFLSPHLDTPIPPLLLPHPCPQSSSLYSLL